MTTPAHVRGLAVFADAWLNGLVSGDQLGDWLSIYWLAYTDARLTLW